MGMTDIHAMNKLKVILGGIINGVATVTFIATRAILWPQGMVMTAGALLGGYSSAHYAQKLPQAWIRAFVIFVASCEMPAEIRPVKCLPKANSSVAPSSSQGRTRRKVCAGVLISRNAPAKPPITLVITSGIMMRGGMFSF